MFSIGFIELLLVAVVGLLVFGPERLPGVVREVMLWINHAKRYTSDIQRDFQEQVEDLENDAMIANMRRGRQLLDSVQQDITDTLQAPISSETPSRGTSDRS